MNVKINVDRRMTDLMDHLHKCMEANAHIDRQEYVLDIVYSAEKYFTAMSNQERDYLHIARIAVEQGIPWNVHKERELSIVEDDDGYAD